MVQPAVGSPTVKGDPVAWAEYVAAVKKMEGLSYRMKMTAPHVTTVMEFVPPHSKHITSQSPAGGSEIIIVGDAYRSRKPGDKWLCPPAELVRDLVPSFFPKLENMEGEVTATRGEGLVIDGLPTRGYNVTYTDNSLGRPYTTNQKLYIGVQTGLLRRAVIDAGGGKATVDAYDYGAKITITLPPCG